jgi:pentatricopeptide repeat protein
LKPNYVTYTSLIYGYALRQDMKQATHYFDEMIARGERPSDITYYSMIRGYVSIKDIDNAERIMEQMIAAKITPTMVVYNRMMYGYSLSLQMHKAEQLYEKMKKDSNIPPDMYTFNCILRGYIIIKTDLLRGTISARDANVLVHGDNAHLHNKAIHYVVDDKIRNWCKIMKQLNMKLSPFNQQRLHKLGAETKRQDEGKENITHNKT